MQVNDLTGVKVGDTLWHLLQSDWQKVIKINHGNKYQIIMESGLSYTINGICDSEDAIPSLFWDKVEFEYPKKPIPKLAVDTKVLVWDFDGCMKNKRHFSHFEGNKICAFRDGFTSFTSGGITTHWEFWELYKEPIDLKWFGAKND